MQSVTFHIQHKAKTQAIDVGSPVHWCVRSSVQFVNPYPQNSEHLLKKKVM